MARRKEAFISVIAGFSFLGIMLGVGTLIIVLSVQNGLRAELVKSVLGFKGHITVISAAGGLRDYAALNPFCTDMDLIGLPWQIAVGPRGLKDGVIELKRRADGDRSTLAIDDAKAWIAERAAA